MSVVILRSIPEPAAHGASPMPAGIVGSSDVSQPSAHVNQPPSPTLTEVTLHYESEYYSIVGFENCLNCLL